MSDIYGLSTADIGRLRKLLADYEAGRLTAPSLSASGTAAPVESYLVKLNADIAPGTVGMATVQTLANQGGGIYTAQDTNCNQLPVYNNDPANTLKAGEIRRVMREPGSGRYLAGDPAATAAPAATRPYMSAYFTDTLPLTGQTLVPSWSWNSEYLFAFDPGQPQRVTFPQDGNYFIWCQYCCTAATPPNGWGNGWLYNDGNLNDVLTNQWNLLQQYLATSVQMWFEVSGIWLSGGQSLCSTNPGGGYETTVSGSLLTHARTGDYLQMHAGQHGSGINIVSSSPGSVGAATQLYIFGL